MMGNAESEKGHRLQYSSSIDYDNIDRDNPVYEKSNEPMEITSKFIGAVNENRTFTKHYRDFGGYRFLKFTMKAPATASKMYKLRREYFIPVKSWNERAKVYINSDFVGTWFMPFGSLVKEFTLKQDDFLFQLSNITDHLDVDGKVRLDFEIRPQSKWNDIAYDLYAVL